MTPFPRRRRAAREQARALAARRARQRADLLEARHAVCVAMKLATKPEVLTDLLSALDSLDGALRGALDVQVPDLADSILL